MVDLSRHGVQHDVGDRRYPRHMDDEKQLGIMGDI